MEWDLVTFVALRGVNTVARLKLPPPPKPSLAHAAEVVACLVVPWLFIAFAVVGLSTLLEFVTEAS
jgi:hypothetical protein